MVSMSNSERSKKGFLKVALWLWSAKVNLASDCDEEIRSWGPWWQSRGRRSCHKVSWVSINWQRTCNQIDLFTIISRFRSCFLKLVIGLECDHHLMVAFFRLCWGREPWLLNLNTVRSCDHAPLLWSLSGSTVSELPRTTYVFNRRADPSIEGRLLH